MSTSPASPSPLPLLTSSSFPTTLTPCSSNSTKTVETNDLSFQSAAYSDTSRKETALKMRKNREVELNRIREDSKAIQQAVIEKVMGKRGESAGKEREIEEELRGYDEKLKEMMRSVRLERGGERKDGGGKVGQLTEEVQEIRREIKLLEERLKASEAQRDQTLPCIQSLSHQLASLQSSFEALNSHLVCASASCHACVLF